MSAPEGGGGKMTGGQIFGLIVGALGGLGVGLLILLALSSIGIDMFGAVKRRYPEVVMGLILFGLVGAFIGVSMGKKEAAH